MNSVRQLRFNEYVAASGSVIWDDEAVARVPMVDAVVVNHNTSWFAELALRSLFAMQATAADACELRVTVRDNHSTDRHSEGCDR